MDSSGETKGLEEVWFYILFVAREALSAQELEPELPDNAALCKSEALGFPKARRRARNLHMRWVGLRACSGAKATGSFTSAAGSGDGSTGASSSSDSFTSHARMHPSCTSSSCRSSPSGSSSVALSRSGPLSRRSCLWCAPPEPSPRAPGTLRGAPANASKQSRCDLQCGILRCSVQKVQDVTPHCRLVNKLSEEIDLVQQTRLDRLEIRSIKPLENWSGSPFNKAQRQRGEPPPWSPTFSEPQWTGAESHIIIHEVPAGTVSWKRTQRWCLQMPIPTLNSSPTVRVGMARQGEPDLSSPRHTSVLCRICVVLLCVFCLVVSCRVLSLRSCSKAPPFAVFEHHSRLKTTIQKLAIILLRHRCLVWMFQCVFSAPTGATCTESRTHAQLLLL